MRINHYVLVDSQDDAVRKNALLQDLTSRKPSLGIEHPDTFFIGIELPTYTPVVHAVAHLKTFEERYGARDYQELRGRQ